jgi:hypothetical protein
MLSLVIINMSQSINAINTAKKGSGVEILKINTNPIFLPLGTSFKINAPVVNNNPNPIKYVGPLCGNSPLSATFDNHVRVHPSGIITCQALQLVSLNPGQQAVITGPNAHVIYTANNIGKANANVTFQYIDEAGKIVNNTSKPFVFDIVILNTTTK